MKSKKVCILYALMTVLVIIISLTALYVLNEKHNVKTASQNENKVTKDIKVQTSIENKSSITIDKKSKVIVIDPGHANRANLQKEPISPHSSVMKIKDGGGAEGIATHTPEYLVNMQVAVKLRAYLEQRGYTVIITKTNNSESLGNIERAEVGNRNNAALVLRIHADGSDNRSASGASMLIPASNVESTKAVFSESKRCAEIIFDTLINEVGMRNRGIVERDDMTGFNWSKVPVVLVEMGFLSNPDEDKLLASQDYEDKLAEALADGICKAEQ